MAATLSSFALLVLWMALPVVLDAANDVQFTRKNFPPGFIFGTASSAYQYEGAASEGGKGPSIWDTFTHQHPEKIADKSNGDIAIDFFHRYKEDIGYMKSMGTDAFRLSIAWSRILPNGSLKGGVNKEGILFYNNLINDLLANGIKPFVTLYHWDTPQTLESTYLGFLSPRIVDDYRDYAELCFKEFGDRVKHWITFNEPWSTCVSGYSYGIFAPGRCTNGAGGGIGNCSQGNSSTEPFIVAHHLLLAHAAAANLYKDKYKASQNGEIGITLSSNWFQPYSNSKADADAASRALDFMLGWFLDPITTGDYPFIMRARLGDRLPFFTPKQSILLKGSFDFVGINYYTTYYAQSLSLLTAVDDAYTSDARYTPSGERKGIPLGPQAGSSWLIVYPPGFEELLVYVKNNYNDPVIYITENGVDEVNNASLPLEQALDDQMRIDYHFRHLVFLEKAIRRGVKVKGYFAWSMLDNFEWATGYTVRFGIVYVDYINNLKRYPKKSYYWFQKFLQK